MKSIDASQRRVGIFFMLPLTILVIVCVFIPEIATVVLSLSEWHGMGGLKWNGVGNFVQLLNDKIFLRSLLNTVVIGSVSAILSLLIGLMLAICLQILNGAESIVYRTVLYIPVIIPLTIVGLLFKFVLNNESGILNQFLSVIGLGSITHAWLSEPATAVWSLTFVEVWKNAGMAMLLIYASLITIPESIYEAARIDGATYMQTVRRISIPLIKPVIKLSLTYLFILGFKTYDLIYIMTKGGPGRLTTTVPIWMVETAYNFNNFGYAASMGLSFAVVILAVVGISAFVLRGDSYEM